MSYGPEVVDTRNKLRLYTSMEGQDKNFPVEIVAHDEHYRECHYFYLSKEEARTFCQSVLKMIEEFK
jgi:hypothetical protein